MIREEELKNLEEKEKIVLKELNYARTKYELAQEFKDGKADQYREIVSQKEKALEQIRQEKQRLSQPKPSQPKPSQPKPSQPKPSEQKPSKRKIGLKKGVAIVLVSAIAAVGTVLLHQHIGKSNLQKEPETTTETSETTTVPGTQKPRQENGNLYDAAYYQKDQLGKMSQMVDDYNDTHMGIDYSLVSEDTEPEKRKLSEINVNYLSKEEVEKLFKMKMVKYINVREGVGVDTIDNIILRYILSEDYQYRLIFVQGQNNQTLRYEYLKKNGVVEINTIPPNVLQAYDLMLQIEAEQEELQKIKDEQRDRKFAHPSAKKSDPKLDPEQQEEADRQAREKQEKMIQKAINESAKEIIELD